MSWFARLPRAAKIVLFVAATFIAAVVVYRIGYVVGQVMADTSFLGGGG